MATIRQRQIAGAVVAGTGSAAASAAVALPFLYGARRAATALSTNARTAAGFAKVARFGPAAMAAGIGVYAVSAVLSAKKAHAQVKGAGGTDREAAVAAGLGALGGADKGVAIATTGTATEATLARQRVEAARLKAEAAQAALDKAAARVVSAKGDKERRAAQRDVQKRGSEAVAASEAYRSALDSEKAVKERAVGAPGKVDPNQSDGRSLARAVYEDIKSWMGSSKENPFAKEKAQIEAQIAKLQAANDREQGLDKNGKPLKPGQGGGFGRNARDITAEISKQQDRLASVTEREQKWRKEQDVVTPVLTGAALLGASVTGLAFGASRSGIDKVADAAAKTAKEVNKLSKEAAKIANKRGVLAGTPAGDSARGIVNEVYARGGAKPAFASPGYPVSNGPAQTLFSRTAASTKAAYVLPGLYAVESGIAFGASMIPDQPQIVRNVERVAGAFFTGAVVGSLKTVGLSRLPMPSQSGLATIEGLRNRVARETAQGAEKALTKAQVRAANVTASGRAKVASNKAQADVAASAIGRDRMLGAAAAESAQLGVTRARKAATVGVARATAKGNVQVAGKVQRARGQRAMAQIDAATRARNRGLQTTKFKTDAIGTVYQTPNRKGGLAKAVEVGSAARARRALPAPDYKNQWTDKRGVTRRRRDYTVRKR